MAGFGQNRKATGVHDKIMVRVIVLADGKRKVAFACADLVGLFHPSIERIRKELPDFVNVTVSSTHNHEGPDTMGLWGASPFASGVDREYLKRVEATIAETIQAAASNLHPANAFIGKVKAPELLRDSRRPEIKHDELVALRFENDQKKIMGVVVQFNNHPETLSSKNTELTADYVAGTVAEVREKQGCPVVYITGTVGGLMTSLGVPVKNAKGEELKDGTFEKADVYGRLIGKAANAAIDHAEAITLTPFVSRTQTILLPVDNKLYQLGWQLGVLNRDIYLWNDDPMPKEFIVAKNLQKPTALKSEVGYLQLGELGIAVIPGEIYPELVLSRVADPADANADFPDAPIEPGIYANIPAKHRMIIGLGNDEVGYILPRRSWDEMPPYTYGYTKAPYGEENSLGSRTGPIICEVFQKVAKGK